MNKFAYSNEEDKCYGLTGMVISLNVLDQSDVLRQISLDDVEGESISFTPDFYFCSNPRFSAKIAWNEELKQYQILTGMVVGNILCRHQVRNRKSVTNDLVQAIRQVVDREGREGCQLEKDEIDMIFNKTFNYISNLYCNSRVAMIARKFATELLSRRTMSGSDVTDELELLRRGI